MTRGDLETGTPVAFVTAGMESPIWREGSGKKHGIILAQNGMDCNVRQPGGQEACERRNRAEADSLPQCAVPPPRVLPLSRTERTKSIAAWRRGEGERMGPPARHIPARQPFCFVSQRAERGEGQNAVPLSHPFNKASLGKGRGKQGKGEPPSPARKEFTLSP